MERERKLDLKKIMCTIDLARNLISLEIFSGDQGVGINEVLVYCTEICCDISADLRNYDKRVVIYIYMSVDLRNYGKFMIIICM